MRSSLILLVLLPGAFGSVFRRAGCKADNCARAVTGSAKGDTQLASRLNDCRSFQVVVSYPAASTTTVSAGSTTTTITAATANTIVTASNLPAYVASACTPMGSAASRFASACSCASITVSTTTAPTPVATVVVPTAAAPLVEVSCSSSTDPNVPGAGGCPDSCYCNKRISSDSGVCNTGACGTSCTKDADCGINSFCGSDQSIMDACGGPQCLDYSQCAAT